MIIYIIIILLCIFAIYNEKRQYNESYLLGKPDKNNKYNKNSIYSILKKIKICTSYDFKTIKWRRIFLASVLSAILLYFIIYSSLPNERDFLLTIIILFLVISVMWYSYINTIGLEINKYCDQHILDILKILRKCR